MALKNDQVSTPDTKHPKILQENDGNISKFEQQVASSENLVKIGCELDTKNSKRILEKDVEIANLKQKLSKLTARVDELKEQILEQNDKIHSLNVINEMLIASNESRHETIIEYKKKLKKITHEGSTSNFNSLSENLSLLMDTFEDIDILPSLNAMENTDLSDYNELTDNDSFSMSDTSNEVWEIQSVSSNSDPFTENLSPIKDTVKQSVTPKVMDSSPPSNAVLRWRFRRKSEHAMGTRGSWFCLHCVENGNPLNIATYPEYRQHQIEVHNEVIDSALCVKCGWRSRDGLDLDFHMYKQHQVPSLFYSFSQSEF